jgi:hypothetical protein
MIKFILKHPPTTEIETKLLKWEVIRQLKINNFTADEILPIADALEHVTPSNFISVLSTYMRVEITN